MDTPISVEPDYVEIVRLLLLQVVCILVDEPGLASVSSVTQADRTSLTVRVSDADFGKIVGKQGRTARSVRTILAAAGMKYQHRFLLDIQDPSEANLLNRTSSSRP